MRRICTLNITKYDLSGGTSICYYLEDIFFVNRDKGFALVINTYSFPQFLSHIIRYK